MTKDIWSFLVQRPGEGCPAAARNLVKYNFCAAMGSALAAVHPAASPLLRAFMAILELYDTVNGGLIILHPVDL